MNLVLENHVEETLQGTVRNQEKNFDGLSMGDIWKIVNLGGAVGIPQSSRPVLGPVVDFLRKYLWRLLGIQPKQLNWAMNHILASTVAFRKGTMDREIFLNVVLYNEYRLPDSFSSDDIVVDIGMHIGSFAFASLLRGCGQVHGFEAERQNFNLAARNLHAFGDRVHLYKQAVWRSDRTGDLLCLTESYDVANTGGWSILHDTKGKKVDLIAFDDVIWNVTGNGQKRIRLVKIDCEGSEFPILLTSRLLHLIDNIHGEYHHGLVSLAAQVEGVRELTILELTSHLQRAGFAVKSFPMPNSQAGLFFATRPGRELKSP